MARGTILSNVENRPSCQVNVSPPPSSHRSPPDSSFHCFSRCTVHASPNRRLIKTHRHRAQTVAGIHRPNRRPPHHLPTRNPRQSSTHPGPPQPRNLIQGTKIVELRFEY